MAMVRRRRKMRGGKKCGKTCGKTCGAMKEGAFPPARKPT
jgi:hypothetical protein